MKKSATPSPPFFPLFGLSFPLSEAELIHLFLKTHAFLLGESNFPVDPKPWKLLDEHTKKKWERTVWLGNYLIWANRRIMRWTFFYTPVLYHKLALQILTINS